MARRPAINNMMLAGHDRLRASVVGLILFDAATIEDLATYADPNQEPAGISNVIANGQVACDKGRNTGTSAAEMVRFRRAVP